MTAEIIWVTLVIFVATALGTGILGYFKGFKDGAKDTAEFIEFLKRSENKESEDTE
jgi:hypothetical protein